MRGDSRITARWGFGIGLLLVGVLALGGLAVPVASGYLWPATTAGDGEISQVSTPMVRTHWLFGGARRSGQLQGRQLVLVIGPDDEDCAPLPDRT